MSPTSDRSQVSDLLIDANELPWVPQDEGVWFKPLRLAPEEGVWINLLKFEAHGRLNRHRHLGPVEAWVLQGRWRYLEHDWVAGPGSFVYEPTGDVHTLIVESGEEMITLFNIRGAIEYLDDDDQVVKIETADTKLNTYMRYCREQGIEALPVVF